MNPAERRLSELLEKWLTSLELHLKYSTLDEAAYRRVQPWPAHERPSRWVIELGLQKVRQLQEQFAARMEMGDGKFADALELMGFLTNLVGSQHIRRFIPLAEPQTEAAVSPATPGDSTITTAQPAATSLEPPEPTPDHRKPTRTAQRRRPPADDSTREMPKPKAPASKPPAPPRETKTSGAARTRAPEAPASDHEKLILADATRLLGWGRQWHELPELIARMANRPSIQEVRRVLRTHKSTLR